MASWELSIASARTLEGIIQSSSTELKKLVGQYTDAKQQLLDSWEGSLKDEFVRITANAFEESCLELATQMLRLSQNVRDLRLELERRDDTAF